MNKGIQSCTRKKKLQCWVTKKSVSIDNGGDGNYGGNGTIAIVDNEGAIIETIQEATEEEEVELGGGLFLDGDY